MHQSGIGSLGSMTSLNISHNKVVYLRNFNQKCTEIVFKGVVKAARLHRAATSSAVAGDAGSTLIGGEIVHCVAHLDVLRVVVLSDFRVR